MTGGEVYVNGQQINEITESMMGGGMGGFGGGRSDGNFGGQMSEGMTPPDFENGERPQRPDGNYGGRGGEQAASQEGTAA